MRYQRILSPRADFVIPSENRAVCGRREGSAFPYSTRYTPLAAAFPATGRRLLVAGSPACLN